MFFSKLPIYLSRSLSLSLVFVYSRCFIFVSSFPLLFVSLSFSPCLVLSLSPLYPSRSHSRSLVVPLSVPPSVPLPPLPPSHFFQALCLPLPSFLSLSLSLSRSLSRPQGPSIFTKRGAAGGPAAGRAELERRLAEAEERARRTEEVPRFTLIRPN